VRWPTPVVVKLFRYTAAAAASPEGASGGAAPSANAPGSRRDSHSIELVAPPGAATSNAAAAALIGGIGAAAPPADVRAMLALQYRLCGGGVRHEHVLPTAAVYPHVYEVLPPPAARRSLASFQLAGASAAAAAAGASACSGASFSQQQQEQQQAATAAAAAVAGALETPEPYLTSAPPSGRARYHRVAAVVTALAPGGSLRDALARGAFFPGGAGTAAEIASSAAAVAAGPLSQQLRLHPSPVAAPMPCIPLLRALLLQVARGMAALHRAGFSHGELRPGNILLAGRALPDPSRPADVASALAALAAHDAALAANRAARRASQQQQRGREAAAAGQEGGETTTAAAPSPGPTQVPLPPLPFSAKIKDVGMTTIVAAAPAPGAHLPCPSPGGGGGGGGFGSSPAASPPLALVIGGGTGGAQRLLQQPNAAARLPPLVVKMPGRVRQNAAAWLAPEMLRARPRRSQGSGGRAGGGSSSANLASPEADVYAFGVLMRELYLGRLASATPMPPLPPHCPRWYVELAARCAAERPSQRPSARRVAAALAAADGVAP
jgi:hypothetical protein